jgi:hypothetical protein
MPTKKLPPFAILSVLFLSLTVLCPLAATAQLLEPADIQSFPVGKGPYFVLSDGANIWVTNSGERTVTNCGPMALI